MKISLSIYTYIYIGISRHVSLVLLIGRAVWEI